jgi:hypothetical protein
VQKTTPFELDLSNELEVERQRFANEWLFRWHSINIPDRVVDVEDFRGGRIYVGGVLFEGQLQQIYWQAIERYLLAKVHAVFRKWDEETRAYSENLRLVSLGGTKKLLLGFSSGTIKRAAYTDRALRGRGFPQEVDVYSASGEGGRVTGEIARVMDSYKALLESGVAASESSLASRIFQRIELLGTRYRGTIAILALAAAVVFGLWKIFGA